MLVEMLSFNNLKARAKDIRQSIKQGLIKGYQIPTGTIIVEEDKPSTHSSRVIIYARVSDHASKDHLEKQAQRLIEYAKVNGYQKVWF